MLKELKIKNLAIIDDLTVNFEKGLNVLTGETGAGKSIIVDALGLALGDRAQTDFVKAGEKEAAVQAYFELDQSFTLSESLSDAGIDYSEGIMLRRVVSAGGKSRAYVNDTMVTLQTMAEMGRTLVDIHSQHEHQSLLTTEKQRGLLDSFGKLQSDVQLVASLYSMVARLKDEHAGLAEKIRERSQRTDLLRFQIHEINGASLKADEKGTLEEEKKILSNLNKLNELTETAYALLYDSEGSCSERLSAAISRLREMSSIDSGIDDTLKMIESSLSIIDDASFVLRGYRDRYDFEPGRLEFVEERIELIRKLEKKYGAGIEAILSYRNTAEEELKALESTDERLAGIEKELEKNQEELLRAAESLSGKRKKTASKIEALMTGELDELSFGKAGFRIDVRQEKDDNGRYRIGMNGMDRIEFLFSANPGEPLKPLAKIASGGELSRVMLALKSILADVDNVPVLIFDEVDAGIGGRTAESVGMKLEKISKSHQLLCITHLPQIASCGNHHLKIEKKEINGRVHVEVEALDGPGRRDEIARMLGGRITDLSRKHAGELLQRVK